jgi:hypothetical protein
MYLLVKVIFVAVDGGPETLSSETSSNNDSGYLLEREIPCVLHVFNQKIGKAWNLINLESLPISSVVVFWIRDSLVRIRISRSVPLTYGSRSCSFSSLTFKLAQNMSFIAFQRYMDINLL